MPKPSQHVAKTEFGQTRHSDDNDTLQSNAVP